MLFAIALFGIVCVKRLSNFSSDKSGICFSHTHAQHMYVHCLSVQMNNKWVSDSRFCSEKNHQSCLPFYFHCQFIRRKLCVQISIYSNRTYFVFCISCFYRFLFKFSAKLCVIKDVDNYIARHEAAGRFVDNGRSFSFLLPDYVIVRQFNYVNKSHARFIFRTWNAVARNGERNC